MVRPGALLNTWVIAAGNARPAWYRGGCMMAASGNGPRHRHSVTR